MFKYFKRVESPAQRAKKNSSDGKGSGTAAAAAAAASKSPASMKSPPLVLGNAQLQRGGGSAGNKRVGLVPSSSSSSSSSSSKSVLTEEERKIVQRKREEARQRLLNKRKKLASPTASQSSTSPASTPSKSPSTPAAQPAQKKRRQTKSSSSSSSSSKKQPKQRRRLRKLAPSDDEWEPEGSGSDSGSDSDEFMQQLEPTDDEEEWESTSTPSKKKKTNKASKSAYETPSKADESSSSSIGRSPSLDTFRHGSPSSSSSAAVETDLGVADYARQQMKVFFYNPSGDASAAASEQSVPRQDPNRVRRALSKAESSSSSSSSSAQSSDKVRKGNVDKWLHPTRIRDGKERRPDHPEYDPSTLYLPPALLKEMSPGQQQYWYLKKQNFDVVMFFKMGKFYELFDNDAEVGNRELGLAYMKGDRRHSGFPEAAFEKYAKKLVALGYKVARVEQVETPAQMKDRIAKHKKKRGAPKLEKRDRVVRRKMCALLSQGTLVEPDYLPSDHANYMLAFVEDEGDEASGAAATALGGRRVPAQYGVCYVDCSTGRFCLGQFEDDMHRTSFSTLLAQVRPSEIVFPRGQLSATTQNVLRKELRIGVMRTPLKSFWDAQKTGFELNGYFKGGESDWPEAVRTLRGSPLALSALGGCIAYMRRILIDEELITLRNFSVYLPYQHTLVDGRSASSPVKDAGGSSSSAAAAAAAAAGAGNVPSSPGSAVASRGAPSRSAIPPEQEFLILDSQTLQNLEVLQNQEGGSAGTLLDHLDGCVTPFGSRLIREWLTRPLGRRQAIDERLDAVQELLQNSALRDGLHEALKGIPDLERMMARLHAHGMARNSEAIMYTDMSAKKIDTFLKVLGGLERCLELRDTVTQQPVQSALLRKLTTLVGDGGLFPDVAHVLEHFNSSFDKDKALKKKKIFPFPGKVPEYDAAKLAVEQVKQELDDYLRNELMPRFGRNIKYVHRNKERYQVEIKKSDMTGDASESSLGADFELKSRTKSVRRYSTPRTAELAEREEAAVSELENQERNIMRTIFRKFCEHYREWSDLVHIVAQLDCLYALALTSSCYEGASCRPEFVRLVPPGHPDAEAGDKGVSTSPLIELRGATHPALLASSGGSADSFIPNDTVLGAAENPASFVLVSGPNMGGKSTLLRQTCVCVLLAHVGCFVPAESCRLTPVDRIFTRVGANDRIMHGQSTFLVELEETSNILHHASARSLVILDELGRGTSTFDGTAIAYAVTKYLCDEVRCMTLFSTHYHMLMSEFEDDPLVSMYHMACVVNDEEENVTFLYKFVRGTCPKSYGMNVARLAGLPDSLVAMAKGMSEQFEHRLKVAHLGHSPAAQQAAAIRRAARDIYRHLGQLGDDTPAELFAKLQLLQTQLQL